MEGRYMGAYQLNSEIESGIDLIKEENENNFVAKENNHININTDKPIGVVGLYNLGNTCYMNSLLQCLKNVYPLTDFIFTVNLDYRSFIAEYKQLLCNLISTKNNITDALDYYTALGKIDSYYASHEQRDSSKLFLTHIKALIDDTRTYISQAELDSTLEKNEPKLVKRYKKSKERNPSILYDYFYGFLKNINICSRCKQTDITYQPFSLISLNLTNERGIEIKDIYKLIENYERQKKSDMLCQCGNYLIEQSIFGRIPPVLVFKFERSVNGHHINYRINYPSELHMKNYSNGFLDKNDNINNPDLIFNLVGVMLHSGDANFGHKTSFTKNFIDNKWYYFNDTDKKEIFENNALNVREAFMLFYISKSRTISGKRIKAIINIAEGKSTICNYEKKKYYYYKNSYNYNYNYINNQYIDEKYYQIDDNSKGNNKINNGNTQGNNINKRSNNGINKQNPGVKKDKSKNRNSSTEPYRSPNNKYGL